MATEVYPQGHGTVKPWGSFKPSEDAENLHKAMKGVGCFEKGILNILCYRTNAQRQTIKDSYKTLFGKDLVQDLLAELKGHFEELIVGLMYSPYEYDAHFLRKAMKGAGTDESVMIEILCTRSNQQIFGIGNAYKKLYGRDLEKDIVSDTSGHFQRLLVSLSSAGRDETTRTDDAKAAADAKALLAAGEKQWGTEESVFNRILCAQNPHQLKLVFQQYHKLVGHDIEKTVEKEFSGDVQKGLLAVVKSIRNRPSYFAEKLYKSMKGMGTDDDTLIQIVVSRCEVDMVEIKTEFEKTYGKSLEKFIKDDTSGSYKEALIALIGGKL